MITGELDDHIALVREKQIREQIWVVKRNMLIEKLQEEEEERKRKLLEEKKMRKLMGLKS